MAYEKHTQLDVFFFSALTPVFYSGTRSPAHLFSHRIIGNTLLISSSLNLTREVERVPTVLSDLLSNVTPASTPLTYWYMNPWLFPCVRGSLLFFVLATRVRAHLT